ncbi:MAG TPA: MmcQ/YjbR family DNA-binding protein [Chryseosolibacter sp.]
MVELESFRNLALSLPGAVEAPHFEKNSFRIKKKIFATLDSQNKRAVLKLSPEDQSVFCAFDSSVFYPVPNKWGKQGWTMVELKKVRKDMCQDALKQAYYTVSGKREK